MQSGRPADALEAYERVYALTHDAAILYNMARAHQALTNYPRAEELLQRFKREAPKETLDKVPGVDRLLEEVAAHLHTLTIRSTVSGAEVRIDGRVVGKTPLDAPLRVNAGAVEIEVSAEGFEPFRRRVELAEGNTSTIAVELVRVVGPGVVHIRSPNVGAMVDVDGQPSGTTPLDLTLPAGTHELRVSKAGFVPWRSTVLVAAGQNKEINADLAAEPGLLSRWWFWTGVGAVVAGGVVTYAAVTTEKKPPTGSIPPGQVTIHSRY
jgi:hypothetical protein